MEEGVFELNPLVKTPRVLEVVTLNYLDELIHHPKFDLVHLNVRNLGFGKKSVDVRGARDHFEEVFVVGPRVLDREVLELGLGLLKLVRKILVTEKLRLNWVGKYYNISEDLIHFLNSKRYKDYN